MYELRNCKVGKTIPGRWFVSLEAAQVAAREINAQRIMGKESGYYVPVEVNESSEFKT